jgi:hypothetical protein
MRGSLGEKIGEGVSADVHAWAPGQVLKLFKADIPGWFARYEARMTRAVFAAGGPAPEVLDEVTVDGRFGIVLPRLDGPTLLQLLRTGAITPQQGGAILAALYMSVHRTPPPREVFALRDWFEGASRRSDRIPQHIATGVISLMERLPHGDGLCHADLHSGNVIMTADGPRPIDWVGTLRAPAAFDLGRFEVLTDLLPEGVDLERPRAVNAALRSEYARLAGTSPAALTGAIELCQPIVCAIALAERWMSPAQRERLIRRIEASLRGAD